MIYLWLYSEAAPVTTEPIEGELLLQTKDERGLLVSISGGGTRYMVGVKQFVVANYS